MPDPGGNEERNTVTTFFTHKKFDNLHLEEMQKSLIKCTVRKKKYTIHIKHSTLVEKKTIIEEKSRHRCN